jgi:hypothetical protein
MSTKTTKQTENKFVTKVLANLNKTEKELQKENIERFVEDSIVEAETAIAMVKTSKIPGYQNELKRLEVQLQRAKDNFEIVRFSTNTSFASYVAQRESALDNIEEVENKIQSKLNDINDAEAELKTLESILADFK